MDAEDHCKYQMHAAPLLPTHPFPPPYRRSWYLIIPLTQATMQVVKSLLCMFSACMRKSSRKT